MSATTNRKRLPRSVNLSGFELKVFSVNAETAVNKENEMPNTVPIIWVCLH